MAETKEREVRYTNSDADLPVFYANNVETLGSNLDVRLRFGQLQTVAQDVVEVKNVMTVYMSVEHTRLFAARLNELIEKIDAFRAKEKP